ncbi:MAG: hypothetical protein AB1521_14655 [Bacteroidota bacterium]
MKNQKILFMAANFLWLSLFVSGCKEYTTKTKINSDGSCERVVIVEGDTTGIALLPFPVPTEKSWSIKTKKSYRDSSKFIFTASKIFNDVNELNEEYSDSGKIGVAIKFDKKFRWFYTYYEYEETYKSFLPYKMIPLNEYLTESEYKSFLNDDTTKALKERLGKYAGENFLEYFLSNFLEKCKQYNIDEVNERSIKEKKQVILEYIDHNESDGSKLTLFLKETFNSDAILNLQPFVEKMLREIKKKMEWITGASGAYTNQVTMPGMILSTNSKSINGNTVEWKVYAERFLYDDFVMKVESRSANLASFIITGILTVGLLIALIIPKWKKR